jgi:hypothetical protein
MDSIDVTHALMDVETFAWCAMRHSRKSETRMGICIMQVRIGQRRASRNRVEEGYGQLKGMPTKAGVLTEYD